MSSPKIGVVIHTTLRDALFIPEDRARLNALGDVTWTDSAKPISTEEACRILADCEIGVGSWQTPYPNAALVAACPRLKLWEHVAGTVKHMFGPHLAGRDLIIASCKTANADSVAEMTLGEIILGLRRVFENAAANRLGPAPKPANLKLVYGSTIGIVGASQIGRRVIRLLQPFGCTILVYDPFLSEEQAGQMGVRRVPDLVRLCAESDVVSLHTPNLPETRHILGAREFAAMKDNAIFINTARGACVDEAALIAELRQGRLFAFLDVTSPEPPAPDSPLRRLPNVVYTSHIGGPATPNLGRQAVDDIAAFLRGDAPLCVVTEEELSYTA
jgi:phosphoglycerate dehydrogenase-like enzyme